jgi:hypothetical protein
MSRASAGLTRGITKKAGLSLSGNQLGVRNKVKFIREYFAGRQIRNSAYMKVLMDPPPLTLRGMGTYATQR